MASSRKRIVYKVIGITALCLLAYFGSIPRRSADTMLGIAGWEFRRYLSDLRVDPGGFAGPAVARAKKNAMGYTWEKRKDDTTAAVVTVIVGERSYSAPAVSASGAEAYWDELRSGAAR